MKINKTILNTMICVAMSIALFGCKTTPTPETTSIISKAVGVSAALICNKTVTSNDTRVALVELVKTVKATSFISNNTFEAVFKNIASAKLGSLVKENKITQDQSLKVYSLFITTAKGMDNTIKTRYPKISDSLELLECAKNGFCDGFLKYFKVATSSMKDIQLEYDEEAYNYMCGFFEY